MPGSILGTGDIIVFIETFIMLIWKEARNWSLTGCVTLAYSLTFLMSAGFLLYRIGKQSCLLYSDLRNLDMR